MTLEIIIAKLKAELLRTYGCLTIQVESIEDDQNHLGVSVFGVESSQVKAVRNLILAYDLKFCAGRGMALTPLVRSLETTRKFYPALMPQAAVSVEYWEQFQVEEYAMAGIWLMPSTPCMAGNEELALAA